MNSEARLSRTSLQKREIEILRLLRQMKFDELQHSAVYKNLELELQHIQSQLALVVE